MSKYGVHICVFDSTGHLRGRRRTYEAIKAAVLEVGKFSTFEATADMKSARLFTRLCKDPEIETFDLGFPWMGVRKRGVRYHSNECDCHECCYARKHPQLPRLEIKP